MKWLDKLHRFMSPGSYKPPTPYHYMHTIASRHMLLDMWDSKIIGGVWDIRVNGTKLGEETCKTYLLKPVDRLKIELGFNHDYIKITYEYLIPELGQI